MTGAIDNWYMPKKAPHPKAAKIVLDFFASRDAQYKFNEIQGSAPANKWALAELAPTQDPAIQHVLAAYEKASFFLQTFELMTPPVLSDKLMDALVKFVTYPNQYKTILADLQKEYKSYFKK